MPRNGSQHSAEKSEHSVAPNSAQTDSRYLEFVEQLLYLGSVSEIRSAVTSIPGLDPQKLRQVIETLDHSYAGDGRTAQQRLLAFVRSALGDLWSDERPASPEASPITTRADLLRQSLEAETSLRACSRLRAHRELVDGELVNELESLVVSGGVDGAQAVRKLVLLAVASQILEDPALIARAQLFWAARCRFERRFEAARRRLDRAAALAGNVGDEALEIMVNSSRASLHERMGELELAADSYEQVLAAAERANDEVLATGIRRQLVGTYRSLGRASRALELIDQLLASSGELLLPEHELQLRILKGLLLEDLGDYSSGEVEYQKAERLAESRGDRARQFEAMNNRAASLLKQGRSKDGLRRFRQILQTVKGWGNTAMVASTHNNLGTALMNLDRPADALEEYRRALRFKINSGDHYGEAISMAGVGDALSALGDEEAAKTFHTLLLMPFFESGDLTILTTYVHRIAGGGEIDEQAREALELGCRMARSAGRLAEELILTRALADHHLRQPGSQRAEALLREALERGRARDPEFPLVLDLQVKLAQLLTSQPGRHQEAYELLEDVRERVDRRLSDEVLDERRGEVVSRWIGFYSAFIELLLRRGEELDLPPGQDASTLAFNLHETAKARSFVSMLADAEIAAPATIPEALRASETALLQLERSLQHDSADRVESAVHRLERLRQVADDLRTCWEEMRAHAPGYVRLRTAEPLAWNELRSMDSELVGPRMAFVSFFCAEAATHCFVMRGDDRRLRIYRSGLSRATLSDAAEKLRRIFNGDPETFPPLPPIRRERPWSRSLEFLDELSAELCPFLKDLEDVELLCVAPHGPLHLLPLHALRTPDGAYLLEHFAFSYQPSLSTLSYSLASSPGPTPASGRPSVYLAGVASRTDAHPDFFEGDQEIFDAQHWHVVADAGKSHASRQRVLENLSDHQVVHLTCHGYFDGRDPLSSGLLFSDGHERPPRDPRSVSVLERGQYVISARDLLRRTMGAELVTLRACSTGLQQLRNVGDELDGLARALLYAGNGAVMVSLWNVDQRSSLDLLARFYRRWREQPTGERWRALWEAQKSMLDHPEPHLRHPYHWAPFVLIGDWR